VFERSRRTVAGQQTRKPGCIERSSQPRGFILRGNPQRLGFGGWMPRLKCARLQKGGDQPLQTRS
jgi:hypothetical protein